jgi:16S rRNA (guanine527-N7)-methyltransferase
MRIVSAGAGTLGLSISESQSDLYVRYCALLLEAGSRMNLSAHRTPDAIMRFLVLDSLTLLAGLPPELRTVSKALNIVDVGSGAGVPGISLKIARPNWAVRLVESTAKKARFLEAVIRDLSLRDISVSHRRAEELGREPEWRDSADLVVARAVAPLPSLLELCGPFARPGGVLALPKGFGAAGEMADARAAARALRLKHAGTSHVPDELGLGTGHVILLYRKEAPTPSRYPRQIGTAKSRPIRERG